MPAMSGNMLRRRLVTGVFLLVVGGAVVFVVFRPTRPATAVAMIEQAEQRFARSPTLHGQAIISQGKDLITLDVWYRGTPNSATRLTYESTPQFSEPPEGTFRVAAGGVIKEFDTQKRTLDSRRPPASELAEFAPFSLKRWLRTCRDFESLILPDEKQLERSAHHLRCGDLSGTLTRAGFLRDQVGPWDLWLDGQTGLLLKVVGEPSLQFMSVEVNERAPADTFAPALPAGARDLAAERKAGLAALDALPSFRAEISRTLRPPECGESCVETGTISFKDATTARWEGGNIRAERDTAVFAGGRCRFHNGVDRTIFDSESSTDPPPADVLECGTGPVLSSLWPALRSEWPNFETSAALSWDVYSRRSCKTLGTTESVARRGVRHLSCRVDGEPGARPGDVWIDVATGLVLKQTDGRGVTFEVTSIAFDLNFGASAFVFTAPAGATSVDDPFRLSKLARGAAAPAWTAPTLGGVSLSMGNLRGKPALVLKARCTIGDPTGCDLLPAFQRTHADWSNRVRLVFVAPVENAVDAEDGKEIPGTGLAFARSVIANRHYTFGVALDTGVCPPDGGLCSLGPVGDAWLVNDEKRCCAPDVLYLLLDAQGQVIEARATAQTAEQLDEWLNDATD